MIRRPMCWLALAAVVLFGGLSPAAAQDDTPTLNPIVEFLIPGLTVPETASARAVLGNLLFHHETRLFQRRWGTEESSLSVGVTVVNNSSNFLPFTGARQFTLIGPSVRFRAPALWAFAEAGGYATHIKSDRSASVNEWDFTPSAAAGLSIPLSPFVSVTAQYRLAEKVSGVNLSGFLVGLQLGGTLF
ncbi:MAG: hypothetical protein QHJ73_10345 [Armatimonadota bacterium]|nr:hypothetical protein [Armatimonadota bacterium]